VGRGVPNRASHPLLGGEIEPLGCTVSWIGEVDSTPDSMPHVVMRGAITGGILPFLEENPLFSSLQLGDWFP